MIFFVTVFDNIINDLTRLAGRYYVILLFHACFTYNIHVVYQHLMAICYISPLDRLLYDSVIDA